MIKIESGTAAKSCGSRFNFDSNLLEHSPLWRTAASAKLMQTHAHYAVALNMHGAHANIHLP